MKVCIFLILTLFVMPAVAQQTRDSDDTARKLADANRKLNDWAELSRYKDANAEIAAPAKGDFRVVFLGDSITDLWDQEGFGGFFPGRPYIDRGISGQTTSQMLIRFHADVIDLRPAVVVLLAGTNDIAGNTGPMTLKQTGDNISAMAELAKAHGIRVVLSSVLPVSDTVRNKNGEFFIQSRSRPPAKIVEMNRWLKAFAAQNGHIYLDYYTAMVDDKGFVKDGITFDGLHPNARGYAIMTPLAEKAILSALKTKK